MAQSFRTAIEDARVGIRPRSPAHSPHSNVLVVAHFLLLHTVPPWTRSRSVQGCRMTQRASFRANRVQILSTGSELRGRDGPLELPEGSRAEQANHRPASPGRLACRAACGRAGGAETQAGSGSPWPPIGAGLQRRLRNWAANAAFLVDGTQIKRGNYSPDAQLA